MASTNTTHGYGWTAIVLHWLAAIAIVIQVLIAWNAEALGDAGDREGRAAMMGLHFSFGATIALLLILRIVAHYAMRQPELLPQPQVLNVLARLNHHLLLLALLVMVISGPLQVLAGGRDISVWNVFTIPSPFAERNEGLREIAHNLHVAGRYALYVLIPLHVLGALKHLVTDKRFRMLKPVTS